MQSFSGFWKAISNLYRPTGLTREAAQQLSQLNPEKFYVENVRSIMGISNRDALKICESGVRQQVFDRGVEVLCPDGSVAVSADSEELLPSTVDCASRTGDHFEFESYETSRLQKVVFYRLKADG